MNRLTINTLSNLRVIFGVLFLYFTLSGFNVGYMMVIFALTVFVDILDGYFARKYDLVTDYGSKIDVICDFLFIIFATSATVLIDLTPAWFLLVIFLKLVEFFITSGHGGLEYDQFGTYVAYMFYAFPIVVILINSKNITLILSIFITICAIASSLKRIKNKRESND